MPSFVVRRRGTDTSGRPLYFTDFFWEVWCAALRDSRVKPFAHLVTIVQGGHMRLAGGGADASAGFHDYGGTNDVRTWNLTDAQEAILWEVMGEFAIHFWKRDRPAYMGGMDEHGHCAAGWDHPLADGIKQQWAQLQNGRDGLARNGPDYMTRKRPLVLYPPLDRLEEEDDMASKEVQEQLNRLEKGQAALQRELQEFRHNTWRRDREARLKANERYSKLITKLGGLADNFEGKAREALLEVLRDEEDVDGVDNPAPGKA